MDPETAAVRDATTMNAADSSTALLTVTSHAALLRRETQSSATDHGFERDATAVFSWNTPPMARLVYMMAHIEKAALDGCHEGLARSDRLGLPNAPTPIVTASATRIAAPFATAASITPDFILLDT